MVYSYFEISRVIQKTQTTNVIYLDTFIGCEQLAYFAFLKTSSCLSLRHLADFPEILLVCLLPCFFLNLTSLLSLHQPVFTWEFRTKKSVVLKQ